MKSLILGISLVEWLSKTTSIIGMTLTAVGLAVVLIAFKVARTVRRDKNVSANDRIVETMRIVGLVLILIGMIIVLF